MAFSIKYPLINGHRYSAVSCEFTISGLRLLGIQEMNYSDSLEPGEIRGTTPYPIGTTAGMYKAEGDMSMPELEWNVLMAKLGNGYGEIPQIIQIIMAESGVQANKHELVGCRIKKVGHGFKVDSSDALMVKIDLRPSYILRNGLALALPRGHAL